MVKRSVCSTSDRESEATLVEVSHWMGDQNLLSRAPTCFGRHVKLLVPPAFAVVSIHSSFKEVVKIIAESLSQDDENMLYRPHLVG
jgi:hypothetical protein